MPLDASEIGIADAAFSSVVIAASILLVAGVIVELCAIRKAPMGYQDAAGFHVGAPDGSNDEVFNPS